MRAKPMHPSLRCMLPGPVLLIALLLAAPVWAEDQTGQDRARLEQLKKEISQLGDELKDDQRERGNLRLALRESDLTLGKMHRAMRKIREDLKLSEQRMAELQDQRRQQLAAGEQQRELVARELQVAYQTGRHGPLKMLLNQQQPETMARSMAYYQYFYTARKRRIEQYLDILASIEALEPELAAQAQKLQDTRNSLSLQQEKLVAGRQLQQQRLQQLNASIKTGDQQLKKMSADRAELERVLEAVRQAVVSLGAPAPAQNRLQEKADGPPAASLSMPSSVPAFARNRGAMPWPVNGKPSNRYGGRRPEGLRWQGLFIPAREGATVAAIHHGRVVFADWLRGSGLLLIIDHGGGYLSLYAHNQTLLREVGEWVSTGAAISTVGNSGGQTRAALYFEIRQNGQPTDPGRWLRRG